jgi:hypothetical protein
VIAATLTRITDRLDVPMIVLSELLGAATKVIHKISPLITAGKDKQFVA